MDIWLTSDFHFGHSNILVYSNRPFSNAYEMNEALIQNFNSSVKEKDKVLFLGDFSMKWHYLQGIFPKLHGKWTIIRGNHDFKLWGKLAKKRPDLMCKIEGIHDLKTVELGLGGKKHTGIVLCHYQMRTWDKKHFGYYHAYGHSHQKVAINSKDKAINVGVDAWNYFPVNLDVIISELKGVGFE